MQTCSPPQRMNKLNTFVAIDIETSNANSSSICQIGLAKFSDNKLVDTWSSLINPKTFFSDINSSIHGITQADVTNSPTVIDISDEIASFIGDSHLVSHTSFDKNSLTKAFIKHRIDIEFEWLDSSRIARRAWEQFNKKGYGLANLAKFIGYEFNHHDALEDAKAAGFITLKAIKDSGNTLENWTKILKVRHTKLKANINQEGYIDGALFGESVVFTGSLKICRKDASDIAAIAGCKVTNSVNTKTTLLIVGDQDIERLAGHTKSTKHRKAEELMLKGQDIKILCESDFFSITSSHSANTAYKG